MKQLLVAGWIFIAVTSAEAAPKDASDWQADPASGCTFIAPRSLPSGAIYWTGGCVDGKASGLGMLRRRNGADPGEVFYGELSRGIPVVGVIDFTKEDQGGLLVGRWKDGDLVSDETSPWRDRFDGFTTAARAASAVSAHFKAQNNAASARFYAQQAKMLAAQIEG